MAEVPPPAAARSSTRVSAPAREASSATAAPAAPRPTTTTSAESSQARISRRSLTSVDIASPSRGRFYGAAGNVTTGIRRQEARPSTTHWSAASPARDCAAPRLAGGPRAPRGPATPALRGLAVRDFGRLFSAALYLGKRLLHGAHKVVQIRHEIPVGGETPGKGPLIFEQSDPHREGAEERHPGMSFQHRRTQQVEGPTRTWDIGHHEVEGRLALLEKARTEGDRRRAEPLDHLADGVRPERLVAPLEPFGGFAHLGKTLEGIAFRDGKGDQPGGDAIAEPAALTRISQTDRGHHLEIQVVHVGLAPVL